MAKKINSLKDYMKVALDYVFDDIQNKDKSYWDNIVKARYEDENAEINYTVKDFANQALMGRTGNSIEAFNLLDRLDREIEKETDPVKKAAAIAVRRVAAPMLYDIAECKTFEAANAHYSKIAAEYEISPKAEEQLNEMRTKSRATIGGLPGTNPLSAAKLEYLDGNQKIRLLSSLVNTFFDREAGERIVDNPAMEQLMEKVAAEVNNVSKSISGEKGYSFKPMDDIEKKDFESLKADYKKMDNTNKDRFSLRTADFTKLDGFINMKPVRRFPQADLTLENNPLIDITAEAFLDNQKNGNLSYTEIEWGEATIDRMLQSVYTDDELRNMKSAGIDPAMGIMVDGKPLSFHNENNTDKSPLDIAKTKCEIIAKALSGSTLSVSKFVPDGKGGYEAGNVVPVKTDMAMKTKKRSFVQWLKQTFGKDMSIKDKVKQANKNAMQAEETGLRKTEAESGRKIIANIKMKKSLEDDIKLTKQLDCDFFNDSFPDDLTPENISTKMPKLMGEKMCFTNDNNTKSTMFQHIDSSASGRRVNILLCYGLTQGYSMDELIHPDNKDLRSQLGAEFLRNYGLQTYDQFLKKNELENSKEVREAYSDYLVEQHERAENLYADMFSAVKNLELPEIDFNNLDDVIEKGPMFNRIGNLSNDLIQAMNGIAKNNIAPSNPTAAKAAERGADLYRLAYTKTSPVSALSTALSDYRNYVASDAFTVDSNKIPQTQYAKAERAAAGKAALNYFNNQQTRNFGNIVDNDKMNVTISSITSANRINLQGRLSAETQAKLNDFIATGNNSPVIDTRTKECSFNGEKVSYAESYTSLETRLETNTAKYDAHVKKLGDKAKGMTFAEAHAAVIEKENRDIIDDKSKKTKEAVTLDELMSEQPEKKEKAAAKEKAPEKAAQMEEDVISFEDMVGKEKPEPINVKQKKAPEMTKEMGGFGI